MSMKMGSMQHPMRSKHKLVETTLSVSAFEILRLLTRIPGYYYFLQHRISVVKPERLQIRCLLGHLVKIRESAD